MMNAYKRLRLKNNPTSKQLLEETRFDSEHNLMDESLEFYTDEFCDESNTNEEQNYLNAQQSTYLIYDNLTKRLMVNPVCYTKTELTEKNYKKLCRALENTVLDSILILGDEGCGKTSLLNNFTQKVCKGESSKSLNGVQIIKVSPSAFPESATEITAELYKILCLFLNQGSPKVILFFDDFTKFPTVFWCEYSTILESLFSELRPFFALLKFVLSVDNDEFYIVEENVKEDVLKSSLTMNINQEVKVNKVIATLKPRISEQMNAHKVKNINYDVLEMIYVLALAEVDTIYASYKRFLINLEKVLCWCDIEGISTLDFNIAEQYFSEISNEIDNEVFGNQYDIEELALHEAGHTCLAMLLSDFIYFSGVSILKFKTLHDDYADGVTITKVDDRTWWMSKEAYTKYIAFYLAGKYAEKSIDGGSFDDLRSANYSARQFVCSSGLYRTLGINFHCDVNDYPNLTEKQKELIDEEVKNLLKEATAYVKVAISSNKEFISIITKKLIEKKFLNRETVLKLWEQLGNQVN